MRSAFPLLAFVLAACSPTTNTQDPKTTAQTADLPVVPVSRASDPGDPAPPDPRTMGDAPAPASAATSPTAAAPATWPTPFAPPAELCSRVAVRPAAIWMRPATTAGKFGQLAKGDHVRLAARTADGWVGFSPGTAQAANVGIFRLRWVRAAEAFAPGDSCASLPVVAAPPLGCVLMAGRAITVHAQPASGATMVGTVPAGSFAQVVKTTGSWVEVLVPGRTAHGYVAQADANFSGPCQ